MNNASDLGPSPLPPLSDVARRVPASAHRQRRRAARPRPGRPPRAAQSRRHRRRHQLGRRRRGLPGWGGYGASKAALDQLTAVLDAENPELRIYAVDPGDMATDMHQAAFPGEDISDRPAPETVVPALLALIDGDLPSGRYRALDLAPTEALR